MRAMLFEAVVAVAGAVLAPATVLAGLIPEVSEDHTGRSLPDCEATTLDGRPFSLSDLAGKPALIHVFASWCPPCQTVMKSVREIHPDYAQRGLAFVGVLADPSVTPETVDEARQALAANPLPYPVLLLNDSLERALEFKGFPATYFIQSDGTFSTTLYGLQPTSQIREIADRVALAAPALVSGPLREAGSASPRARGDWGTHPLRPLISSKLNQWHPVAVHFPITFLLSEMCVLLIGLLRPRVEVARLSKWLLWLFLLTVIPTVVSGIHDSGLNSGPGSALWNGLRERTTNLFRLESTVSLHVLYALAAVTLAIGRLVWRVRVGDSVIVGKRGVLYFIIALLGCWLLFAAAQVGGGITHS